MKTTLNLDDQVLRRAKERAARDGVTLTRFVENALRARLMATPRKEPGFKLRMITVKGKGRPTSTSLTGKHSTTRSIGNESSVFSLSSVREETAPGFMLSQESLMQACCLHTKG